MLIWSGWGILVIVVAVVVFGGVVGATLAAAHALHAPYGASLALAYAVSGAICCVAILQMAKALSGPTGRVLVDRDTGQEVHIHRSAGSLFFIPTRIWGFIALALGVIMAAVVLFNGTDPLSSDEPPSAVQAHDI